MHSATLQRRSVGAQGEAWDWPSGLGAGWGRMSLRRSPVVVPSPGSWLSVLSEAA